MGAFPLIRRNAMAEHHCNPSEPPPAPRGNVPSARSLHSPLARRAFSQCRRLLRSPPPLQALPVPPVDGGISPQRLPGAAGQSPGRAPPMAIRSAAAKSGSAPSPSRRIVRIMRASRFPRGDFPSFCHGSASGPPSRKCPNNRTNDALS